MAGGVYHRTVGPTWWGPLGFFSPVVYTTGGMHGRWCIPPDRKAHLGFFHRWCTPLVVRFAGRWCTPPGYLTGGSPFFYFLL
ncbi:hypothetical protein Taro_038758 [Colocasia esculenta]|uniref:Uncharacterized protein n=1 Tax=Colocasia esculenta TaxID=4460 RepID=A0A843WK69_COLES|nr:hypothetical protein [Colocasia esculenta]